jgi:protein TonB
MNVFVRYIIVLIISVLFSVGNAQYLVDTNFIEHPVEDWELYDGDSGSFQDSDSPVYFTEVMPEFPGGPDSLNAFLSREIQYPPIAKKNGIKGTVLIEFVVEKDGRVTNGKVKVPLFPECDEEALRGVMSMPNWKPGKNMGKPVRCYFLIPITFRP